MSDVIVFDGMCNLCTQSVQFILSTESHAHFYFASAQSSSGTALLQKHGIQSVDPSTFLVIKDGRPYVRSDGAIEVAKHLRMPWRLLTLLRLIPRPLRDAGYNWIARNRIRLFGQRESCMVPSPEIQRRFLP